MSLTLVEPTGIGVAGRVNLYWVPAIADPTAPKLAELNAGVNLSKIVYAWDPNGSQATQERWRYGSESGGTSLGSVKYDPAELEYDYDPQAPDQPTGEYSHYAKLTPGLGGWLVDRRGLAVGSPLDASQVVDLYPAKLGVRVRVAAVASNEGETLHVRQKVAVTGDVRQDVKIAAA